MVTKGTAEEGYKRASGAFNWTVMHLARKYKGMLPEFDDNADAECLVCEALMEDFERVMSDYGYVLWRCKRCGTYYVQELDS